VGFEVEDGGRRKEEGPVCTSSSSPSFFLSDCFFQRMNPQPVPPGMVPGQPGATVAPGQLPYQVSWDQRVTAAESQLKVRRALANSLRLLPRSNPWFPLLLPPSFFELVGPLWGIKRSRGRLYKRVRGTSRLFRERSLLNCDFFFLFFLFWIVGSLDRWMD